jgi:DOPA 4,5-dioxygenase
MYYHAHVYWSSDDEKTTALTIRAKLAALDCGLGRVWDTPIGPHPLPMYQVNYCTTIQEPVEKLLTESGLTVLLHEDTGDDLRDHTEGTRWLGEKLNLDLVWLENYVRNHK